MQEDGRLGDVGSLEVVGRAFEHDVRDAEAEDFIGSFEHLTCFVIVFIYVFCHAGMLGSLAGKYAGCLHILVIKSRQIYKIQRMYGKYSATMKIYTIFMGKITDLS